MKNEKKFTFKQKEINVLVEILKYVTLIPMKINETKEQRKIRTNLLIRLRSRQMKIEEKNKILSRLL